MDAFPLLDELRTIACNGLNYATDPFDIERYQRLLDLASQYYGQALETPAPEVRQRLSTELGYVTPKVGAEAAVLDEDGRLLLVRRADDGCWCLPCGWINPNESPAEAATREAQEETGFQVRVDELVDVFTRKPSATNGPHTAIAIVYLCTITGGEKRTSHETTDIAYWQIEDVPAWHELHQQYAKAAHTRWQANHAGKGTP
jgi:ADP-ribose pyrophosphatase YjhB (NUDIX family)